MLRRVCLVALNPFANRVFLALEELALDFLAPLFYDLVRVSGCPRLSILASIPSFPGLETEQDQEIKSENCLIVFLVGKG